MPSHKPGSYHSRSGDLLDCVFNQQPSMSVYTPVDAAQLEPFLARYRLGKLRQYSAIASGITNTNYYLDTEAGRYVLTLYEHHSDDELDYMLGLQQHLVDRSVRCSRPVEDRRGELFSILNQRPAAIIQRLEGEVQPAPESRHCAIIGAELARFHLAGQAYPGRRINPRGIDWVAVVIDVLEPSLDADDLQIVRTVQRDVHQFDPGRLPRGAVHADLFRDNALFTGDRLGGILDFDYACNSSFVFDIAVLLNDWCIDEQGALVAGRVAATLEAYQQYRRLETIEVESLPLMLRFTALRFWLSRLYDKTFPLSGELTYIKNPGVFRDMLLLRNSQQPEIRALLAP